MSEKRWWGWYPSNIIDADGTPKYGIIGSAATWEELQRMAREANVPLASLECDQFPTIDRNAVKDFIRPRIASKHGVEAALTRRFTGSRGLVFNEPAAPEKSW